MRVDLDSPEVRLQKHDQWSPWLQSHSLILWGRIRRPWYIGLKYIKMSICRRLLQIGQVYIPCNSYIFSCGRAKDDEVRTLRLEEGTVIIGRCKKAGNLKSSSNVCVGRRHQGIMQKRGGWQKDVGSCESTLIMSKIIWRKSKVHGNTKNLNNDCQPLTTSNGEYLLVCQAAGESLCEVNPRLLVILLL